MLHEWKVVTRVQSCNTEEPYLKKYPFICRIVKLEKIFERLNKIKKKDFKRVLENKNINFIYDKENKILKSLVNKNLLWK